MEKIKKNNMLAVALFFLVASSQGQETNISLPSGRVEFDNATTTTPSPKASNVPYNLPPCGCQISRHPEASMEELTGILGSKTIKFIRLNLHTEDGNNLLPEQVGQLFRPSSFVHIDSRQGNALLSLPFNYYFLSLTTLKYQTGITDIKVVQEPGNCMRDLADKCSGPGCDEEMCIQEIITNFAKTDIDAAAPERVGTMPDSACVEKVLPVNGNKAAIQYECCGKVNSTYHCHDPPVDEWLRALHMLILFAKLFFILFGPLMISTKGLTKTSDEFPYRIEQPEPLKRTMYITTDPNEFVPHKVKLATKNLTTFKKFKAQVADLPHNEKLDIQIPYVSIKVSNSQLQTMQYAPVGLLHLIKAWMCQCKVRYLPAYRDCCNASIFGKFKEDYSVRWFMVARVFGALLAFLLMPFPYYLRLVGYYLTEHDEVVLRQQAIRDAGFKITPSFSLLHHFSPTSPLLITIYVIYFLTGIAIFMMNFKNGHRFQVVFKRSMARLNRVNYFYAIGGFIRWMLYPLRRFGLLGLLIGIIYWPLCIVVCLIIFALYCVPLIHLSIAFIIESHSLIEKRAKQDGRPPSVIERIKKSLSKKLTDVKEKQPSVIDDDEEDDDYEVLHVAGLICVNVLFGLICVVALWAFIFIFADVAAYAIEILVYTFIGLIVNAGSIMKYVSIAFLLVLYTYNTFGDVYKTYLALNGTIFGTVFGRIEGISDYTRLRYDEQHHRGFKSKYAEEPDAIIRDKTRSRELQWRIHNLVLFIDRRDKPRIPTKLFWQISDMEVDGAPGPIHYAWVRAFLQLMRLIMFLGFVLVVVFAFSDYYSASPTNQVLATLAGGFFPFFFKSVILKFSGSGVDGTVLFKYKLDEELVHFSEDWPLHDFYFELAPPPEPEPAEEEGDGGEDGTDEAIPDSNDNKDEKKAEPAEKGEVFVVNSDGSLENVVVDQQKEEDDDRVDYFVVLSKPAKKRIGDKAMEMRPMIV